MINKVCGQCQHYLCGSCWLNPPVPTASGYNLRPKVNVDERACGHWRTANGSPTVAVVKVADVPMPTKEEARRIAADMEARGELTVDRTPPPKYAPPGKRKAVEA
jgi:hypothetical protein